MPFGIKNASSKLQRMMDSIIGSFICQFWMMIYIDDLIIYFDDCETHVDKIKIVLETLVKAGLKISIKNVTLDVVS